MAVSTANAVLRQAIVDWRNSFMGVTSDQASDAVQSSLQDICIDARVITDELPPVLRGLYVEARSRVETGRTGTFGTASLIRMANEALGQL